MYISKRRSEGRLRTRSWQQPAQSPFRSDLTVIGQQLLMEVEGWSPPGALRGCQASQVHGSGLGDCHGVAQLLLQGPDLAQHAQDLGQKAEDYLHCTSTPATHRLLCRATQSFTGFICGPIKTLSSFLIFF